MLGVLSLSSHRDVPTGRCGSRLACGNACLVYRAQKLEVITTAVVLYTNVHLSQWHIAAITYAAPSISSSATTLRGSVVTSAGQNPSVSLGSHHL